MLEDRIAQVQEALSRAGALHAIAIGAEEDAGVVGADVTVQIAKAEKSYATAETKAKDVYDAAVEKAHTALEKVKESQNARVAEAQQKAVEAASTLSDHTNNVRQTLGATIDLAGTVSGGHMRL